MKKFIKEHGGKVVIILLFIFLLFGLFSIVPYNKITSYLVSEGGNVTEANISITKDSGYWQAFYGELFEDPQSNQIPFLTVQGGNVTELNLTFSCLGEEIYASTSSVINLQNVIAGDVQVVDDYLQLNPTHLESGSSVFKTTDNFVVRLSNITDIPTTYMKVYNSPGNTTFSLGLLNESGNMVFVGRISYDTIGFDNKRHDYQMMVPVNLGSVTYYFFSDCIVPSALPLPTGRARELIIPYCGDGICQSTENCGPCPTDCGPCLHHPRDVTIEVSEEEILGKESVLFKIIYDFPSEEIILLLKKLLFTTKGIVFLLFIAIILLLLITINIYQRKNKKRKVKKSF
jgi:hypothetical protein